ncbi:MAG: DUF3575 domain-containing protein [Elusimicrobiota bacterium]
MKKLSFVVVLLLVFASRGFAAQEKSALTTNVLSLLAGSVNANYEFATSRSSSLGINGHFRSISVSDWEMSVSGVGGTYSFYPAEEALSGFFIGPSVGIMGVTAEHLGQEDSGTFFTLGGHLGYRWVWSGGITLGLAIGAGYTAGEIEIAGETTPISGAGLSRLSADFGYAW